MLCYHRLEGPQARERTHFYVRTPSIGCCTCLKTVALPNSNLTDADASVLAKAVTQNDSIELIDLSGNDLSDLGCVAFANALKKNTSIQSIRLEGNGKISGEQRTQIETTLRERAGSSRREGQNDDEQRTRLRPARGNARHRKH
jgi:hypothetical protein